MRQHSIKRIDDEGALRLAEAIVGGICDDYRDQLKAQLRKMEAQVQATEALIRSDYFGKLSMNSIGPEAIIRSIREKEELC